LRGAQNGGIARRGIKYLNSEAQLAAVTLNLANCLSSAYKLYLQYGIDPVFGDRGKGSRGRE